IPSGAPRRPAGGCSSVWLERQVVALEVAGSNPVIHPSTSMSYRAAWAAGSTWVPHRSRSPLEQLLDPLVGQPEQLSGIPHAETLGARQPAGGCPRGRLRTGLLALCAGTQNTLARDLAAYGGRQPHVVYQAGTRGVPDEQGERLPNAVTRLPNGPPVGVAPLHAGDRRNPVPGFVQLVDDAIALHHDTTQDPVSGLTIAYLGMAPSLAR